MQPHTPRPSAGHPSCWHYQLGTALYPSIRQWLEPTGHMLVQVLPRSPSCVPPLGLRCCVHTHGRCAFAGEQARATQYGSCRHSCGASESVCLDYSFTQNQSSTLPSLRISSLSKKHPSPKTIPEGLWSHGLLADWLELQDLMSRTHASNTQASNRQITKRKDNDGKGMTQIELSINWTTTLWIHIKCQHCK